MADASETARRDCVSALAELTNGERAAIFIDLAHRYPDAFGPAALVIGLQSLTGCTCRPLLPNRPFRGRSIPEDHELGCPAK